MKKPNENPNISCEDIEKLLVSGTYDQLTDDKNHLIEEHLAVCERCRDYQNALAKLKSSVEIKREEKLTPDSSVRENLVRRMRELRAKKPGAFEIVWQSVRGAFTHRIPVYQVMLGLSLVLVVFITLKQFPSLTPYKPSESQALVRMEASSLSEMSVIDNLEVVRQQKIGWNIAEDTTLMRFVIATM